MAVKLIQGDSANNSSSIQFTGNTWKSTQNCTYKYTDKWAFVNKNNLTISSIRNKVNSCDGEQPI